MTTLYVPGTEEQDLKKVIMALQQIGGRVSGLIDNPAVAGRETLTADRTYYVRTDGSDSNNGKTNSAGGAFLTIAAAFSAAAALDCGIYQLTISVQAGTYNESLSPPRMLSKLIPILTGVGSTTIITQTTGANPTLAPNATTPWHVNNLKITNSSASPGGGFGIWVRSVSALFLSGVDFGACTFAHMEADAGCAIIVDGNYSISGGAAFHAATAGYISLGQFTCTLTGTPAFSTAFVYAGDAGFIWAYQSVYSGSATGPRYLADANGVIFTAGGGANFFPGNSAGSTATGGQYV